MSFVSNNVNMEATSDGVQVYDGLDEREGIPPPPADPLAFPLVNVPRPPDIVSL